MADPMPKRPETPLEWPAWLVERAAQDMPAAELDDALLVRFAVAGVTTFSPADTATGADLPETEAARDGDRRRRTRIRLPRAVRWRSDAHQRCAGTLLQLAGDVRRRPGARQRGLAGEALAARVRDGPRSHLRTPLRMGEPERRRL